MELSITLAAITNKATPSLTGTGSSFFSSFIPKILFFGVAIGGLIFMFMLVIGGINWVTSGGDKSKVEAARSQIVNAIIGVIVLFSIIAIAKVVEALFGINLTNIDLTPFLQTP
jgi:hypothetical protein